MYAIRSYYEDCRKLSSFDGGENNFEATHKRMQEEMSKRVSHNASVATTIAIKMLSEMQSRNLSDRFSSEKLTQYLYDEFIGNGLNLLV